MTAAKKTQTPAKKAPADALGEMVVILGAVEPDDRWRVLAGVSAFFEVERDLGEGSDR